ncbi:hypothetical protein [Gordonia hongkongensis]|uniref:hypothetical protein n=1 Tax=Gordonia hongkongensis TaxID=1701090 RepID=UPI003D71203C
MKVRQDWDAMRAWLIQGLRAMDVGDILDVGPRDSMVDAELVDCADVMRTGDGWVVRLSRIALVDEVAVEGELEPDVWLVDDLATDGVLLTGDAALAAGVVVAWFADRVRVESPACLGFDLTEPV